MKENKSIDSLINAILDKRVTPTITFDDAYMIKDTCLYIYVSTNKKSYAHLSISVKDNKNRNQLLSLTHDNFGYFNYRGKEVFVRSFDKFHEFFTPTKKTSSFIFDKNKVKQMGALDILVGAEWYFDYKDGKFSNGSL